jgi:hypothetical protein
VSVRWLIDMKTMEFANAAGQSVKLALARAQVTVQAVSTQQSLT